MSVVVGVRLRNEGVRERVRLAILTNDLGSPNAEFDVEAGCSAPFDVAPSLVDFGNVVEGQNSSATLTIRTANGAFSDAGTGLRLAVSNEHLSVEETNRDGDERQLTVRLRSNAPRGRLQAELTLTLSGVESPICVPVTGNVVGRIMTAPQSLVLSVGGEGKVLVWRPDGQSLGKLESLELPTGMVAEETSDPTALRRVFRVRAAGSFKVQEPLQVRLRFETVPEVVVVSVRVENSN